MKIAVSNSVFLFATPQDGARTKACVTSAVTLLLHFPKDPCSNECS